MKQKDEDMDFGLEKLISELYKARYYIISAILAAAVLAYAISLFIPNYYVSEAVLFPRSDSEEDAENNSLPNISSMVGINLGGESLTKVDIALEMLQSRKFLSAFIKEKQILVDLFTAKGWDVENQSIIYDQGIYDNNAKKWVRKVKFPKTVVPSDWEAYEELLKVINIEKESSGFIVLSIETRSPVLSKKWLTLLINKINEEMRLRDQLNFERSLGFLEKKVADTNNSSIRDIFYRLIENQTRKMMLTESRADYVLEVLDPPVEPVMPGWPNRMLIILLSVLSTLIISIFVVLIRISIKMGKIN